jgi:ATP-dependent Clp protease ATP-binding subunit ClpC
VNRLLALAQLDLFLRRTRVVRWVIQSILLIVLILGLLGSFTGSQAIYFGLFFIFLPVSLVLDLFRMFLRNEVDREERRQSHEVTHNSITYSTALLLAESGGQGQRLWDHLLKHESTHFVILRFGLTPAKFTQMLPAAPEYTLWIDSARKLAESYKQPLRPEHLFEVVQTTPELTQVWNSLGIAERTRQEVWGWSSRIEAETKAQNRGFIDSLKRTGGIGHDWSSGYTHELDAYAVDLTEQIKQIGHPIRIVGHQTEREKIFDYLNRDNLHNVIIVGEEGIGKQRMLYALASDFVTGHVPMSLKYKHVYMLDVGKLVSAPNQSELELRLRTILDEADTVGNIVLFVPDFHLLVGAQGNSTIGEINAAPVLSSYLQSPSLHLIATITPSQYYSLVKPNAALEPYLAATEIKEIQPSDALLILEDELPRFESKQKHIVTYQALSKIIELAERHIHDKPYPEKALNLLEEVVSGLHSSDPLFILGNDVERIVSEKLKLPIGTVSRDERDVLNNLETQIQTRIVGQKEAVAAVANALRRARAGLHSGKRPIGSFLFLGPTGVGKTEMAKTIAALYYKNEKAFIRIDMSEYQTPDSVGKLIGTKDATGLLTTAVTDQPFSVVLLDEVEKADPAIRNLFLQILDDGAITNGYGQKVDFTNAMIIATSNAGANYIREAVNKGPLPPNFKQDLLNQIQSDGIFSPEWLNRFDAVITFLPLTQPEIRQVAQLLVNELTERLAGHNIHIALDNDVYDTLLERGYDPEFGARPMRRAVQDTIENALAKTLLNDTTEGVKNITITKAMLV